MNNEFSEAKLSLNVLRPRGSGPLLKYKERLLWQTNRFVLAVIISYYPGQPSSRMQWGIEEKS